MDREPDRRPATAGELLDRLERALTGKGNDPNPAGLLARAKQRIPRRPGRR
jgi:hypothetical protein